MTMKMQRRREGGGEGRGGGGKVPRWKYQVSESQISPEDCFNFQGLISVYLLNEQTKSLS